VTRRPTREQSEDFRLARVVAERIADGETVHLGEAQFVARMFLSATAEPTDEELAEEAARVWGDHEPSDDFDAGYAAGARREGAK
jgi:hypothetical protein